MKRLTGAVWSYAIWFKVRPEAARQRQETMVALADRGYGTDISGLN
jgi:hypothetical protein